MIKQIKIILLFLFCCINVNANDTTNPSFYYKTAKDGLKEALIYYNIQHPEIVYAQAIIETGNFTSKGCKNKNNLFGLMQNGRLMTFKHWTESVIFYKNRIQKRYNGGDYYLFLKKIRYASHPQYTQILKNIVRKNKF